MFKRVSSIAMVTLLASAGAALAHEHKVMGTVTMNMASSNQLMMKTTDGHDVTVNVTPKTKITRGNDTVKLDSIREKTRVVVTTASDEAPYEAMAIQVGAAAKQAPKQSPAKKKQ